MPIEKLDGFRYEGQMPDDDTPISEKNGSPSYSLGWMKYIYWCFHTDRVALTSSRQYEILNLRKYAEGQQDSDQYKKKFTDSSKNNRIPISSTTMDIDENQVGGVYAEDISQSRAHFMTVDFSKIFSPAPKYINALIGMFIKTNHDITVTALDSVSQSAKEEKKWRLWVKSKTKSSFDKINDIMGIKQDEEQIQLPNSLQELELYTSLNNFKLRYEVAGEEALIHTEQISETDEIKNRCVRDFAIGGAAFVCDYLDKETMKIKEKYLDSVDVIIEYSKENRYSDSRFGGYIMYFTISEIHKEFPEKSKEELWRLAGLFSSKYGNGVISKTYVEGSVNPNWYDFRIPVLYGCWKTVDTLVKENKVPISKSKVRKKELETGKIKQENDFYYKVITNKVDKVNAVYEAKWVLGTDMVFDYGRINTDTGCIPIHGYMIEGNSIVEQMIPSLDQIQLTYLRLQNAIAKAPPSGLLIDIAGVQGFKMGNKKWSPLDLIRMYTQNGHMLYDSSLRKGNLPNDKVDSRKVIEQLPGGLGNAINEYLVSFEMAFNHLSELTGLSRESFVGGTDPNQSATATKIIAAGTTNTLQPLYNGWVKMRASLSQNVMTRIQILCLHHDDIPEDKGYIPVIGEAGVKSLAIIGRRNPSALGIHITPAPTDDEKMEIRRLVADAQAKGLISPDIATYVTIDLIRGNSLNKIMAFLSYKIEQGRQQQMQAAEANQLRDRETQVVVAQSKLEGEAQLETLKNKNKLAEIQLEKDLELRNEIEKSKLMLNKKPQEV
jgi:hypothetical protein